jgi:hypothetical protein
VKALAAAGGDLDKINMPDESTMDKMVKRMEKFDEAPSGHKCAQNQDVSDKAEGYTGEVMHDTPGLMFAYARRSAEKFFRADSIYR